MLGQKAHSCHRSNHFSETGYFPHLVNPFAVVIGVPISLTPPNAPALGRYFWHALILTEQTQKICEVFHAVLTVTARTALGLHRVAVFPPPAKYRPRLPFHPRMRSHLDSNILLLFFGCDAPHGHEVLYALSGLSDWQDLLERWVRRRKGNFQGLPGKSFLGLNDKG